MRTALQDAASDHQPAGDHRGEMVACEKKGPPMPRAVVGGISDMEDAVDDVSAHATTILDISTLVRRQTCLGPQGTSSIIRMR